MQPVDHQPSDWAQRLGFVRVFARHWSATDPRTEIPAAGLLPFRARRARPYLYTDEEIRQLLAATNALSSTNGLRPWTYHCLFGLLVVSGIRISEAISLDRHDVNLHDGLLTIRKTKFNKMRLIPLHASTQEVFIAYAGRRDRVVPHPTSPAFLLTDRGRRLEISAVHRTFYDLSRRTGLRGPTDHTGPRIHDFRQHAGSRIMPGSAWEMALPCLYGQSWSLPSRHNPAVFFRTALWPGTEETCWITSSRIATRFGGCDQGASARSSTRSRRISPSASTPPRRFVTAHPARALQPVADSSWMRHSRAE
ncbi:MAG: tyrosine-type recombinase/integrase [Acidobacteria bacterium]|nr:tyrosine-type recombinase/integrase [Acidobacteriota bacterium]